MRALLLGICLATICTATHAQVPQAINFQAQARGSDGKLLETKTVKTRFSILEKTTTAAPAYVEAHSAVTDGSGLYSLTIGNGAASQGQFQTIDWTVQPKYLKVELDVADGGGFKLISTFQLASVPYAFHAAKADTSLRDADKQRLSVTGNQLSITNGNSVILPGTASPWTNVSTGISYDKKVGIGTTTPRSALDVISNEGNSQYSINASNTNPLSQAGMAVWNDNGGWLKLSLGGSQLVDGAAFGQSGEATSQILSNHGAKDMLVGTLNDRSLVLGTNNLPRLHIKNDGKIGVGTSSPANALTVNGVIQSLAGGVKFPDGTLQTTALIPNPWNPLTSDPNLLGINYSDGRTGIYEFSNGSPTPGGAAVGLTIKNSKSTGSSLSFIDLVSSSSTPSASRSYISLKNPYGNYTIEAKDSSMYFFRWVGNGGTPIFQFRPDIGFRFTNGNGHFSHRVGIGTTSFPTDIATPLQIRGTDSQNLNISDLIQFNDESNNRRWHLSLENNTDLNFVQTGISQDRLYLKANGNVGIGTSQPVSKLSVAGTIESTLGGYKFPDGSIQSTAVNTPADINTLENKVATLEWILEDPTLRGLSKDIDGNYYKTIRIGGQVWMAENLIVTRYRNGDIIETTTPVNLDVSLEAAPRYQWGYNGTESLTAVYGRYYTWYAIVDSRNVCPLNWHVATDSDWANLGSSLGGLSTTGGKLKEEGNIHWLGDNIGATNSTAFTALPSGSRNQNSFDYLGLAAYYWSNGELDSAIGLHWRLSTNNSELQQSTAHKYQGFSVRCVKD